MRQTATLQNAITQLLRDEPELLKNVDDSIQEIFNIAPQISEDELLNEITARFPRIVYLLGEDLRKNPPDGENQYLRGLFQKHCFNLKTAADFYLYPLVLGDEKFSKRPSVFYNKDDQEYRKAKLSDLGKKLNQEIEAELAKGVEADMSLIQAAHNKALAELKKVEAILNTFDWDDKSKEYLFKPLTLARELSEKLPNIPGDSSNYEIQKNSSLIGAGEKDLKTPVGQAEFQKKALNFFRKALSICAIEGVGQDEIKTAYQKLLDDDLYYFKINSPIISDIKLQFRLNRFFGGNIADLSNASALLDPSEDIAVGTQNRSKLRVIVYLMDLELELRSIFSFCTPDFLSWIKDKIKNEASRGAKMTKKSVGKLLKEIARKCVMHVYEAGIKAEEFNLQSNLPSDLEELYCRLYDTIEAELLKFLNHEKPNCAAIESAIREPEMECYAIGKYEKAADFYLHPLQMAMFRLIVQTTVDNDWFEYKRAENNFLEASKAKRDSWNEEITLALNSEDTEKLDAIISSAKHFIDVLNIFNDSFLSIANADPEYKQEIAKLLYALMQLLINDSALLRDVSVLIKSELAKNANLPNSDFIKIIAKNYPELLVLLGDDVAKGKDREHIYLLDLVQKNILMGDLGQSSNAYYLYPLQLGKENINSAEAGTFKNDEAKNILVAKFEDLRGKLEAELQAELAKGDKARPAKLAGAKNIALEHFAMSKVICDKGANREEKEATILKCYNNTSRDPLWKTVLKVVGIIAITAACAVVGLAIGAIISKGILSVPGAIKGAFTGAAWSTAMMTGTAIGSGVGLFGSSALIYVPRGVTKTTGQIKKLALENLPEDPSKSEPRLKSV